MRLGDCITSYIGGFFLCILVTDIFVLGVDSTTLMVGIFAGITVLSSIYSILDDGNPYYE